MAFQELEVKTKGNGRSARNIPRQVSDVAAEGARIPCDEDLKKAADILNAASGLGFWQAAHFVESIAKGTPGRRKIIDTVVANKVRELL